MGQNVFLVSGSDKNDLEEHLFVSLAGRHDIRSKHGAGTMARSPKDS